jgi:hypothetical protein
MIIKKWEQFGTVLTGKSHKQNNKPCQDRIAYVKKNGVHCISLADGAGSKKKSGAGADVATAEICELLTQRFDDFIIKSETNNKTQQQLNNDLKEIKEEIVRHIVKKIQTKHGTEDGEPPSREGDLQATASEARGSCAKEASIEEYASTLLFFAIKGQNYFAGHIGDGVIGAVTAEGASGALRVLSEPENGGAPNITFFVTDKNAVEHLRLYSGEIGDIKGVVLMCDGVEEVMYSRAAGLNENTKKLFLNKKGVKNENYNLILNKFLTKQISRLSDDDLSLNLLYLEDCDSEQISKDYLDYMLDGVNETVPVSSYAYFLDNSHTEKP